MGIAQHLSSHQATAGRWQRATGGLLMLLAPLLAVTASHAASLPGWLQSETDLRVSPEIIDTRWSSLVRLPNSRPDYSLASASSRPTWGGLSNSALFVEFAPHALGAQPQVFVRPQFALGSSSQSLRGWLRMAGIDASACVAPLMKMHSAFAGGSSRANVSLSARCSLH